MIKGINPYSSLLWSSFFAILFFPGILVGQEISYKLQSNQLTADGILKKWSQISARPLNYRVNDLTDEIFTFSIEGTYAQISSQLYPLLGLQYKEIDEVTIVTRSSDLRALAEFQSIQVNDENGHPLPYAHVSVRALGILDITSIDGLVEVPLPIADSDTIHLKYVGYQDALVTFGLLKAKQSQVSLSPSLESISEVVILGSQTRLASIESIDPADIPQASSVDNDALTIAQNIPGISNPSESFQDLVIRGGSPDQVQYQWNGIRVLQSSHFFGKVSAINPYMVDKLEISKDGYSAGSSGTISGGLHMKSDNRIDKTSVTFHLNMLYANLGVSIPLSPKFSAKFAIRQALPRKLQSPLANTFIDQTLQFGKIPDEEFFLELFDLEDVIRRETGVTFGDQQISLRYQPHPKTSLSLDFIRLHNQLDYQTISEKRDVFTKDLLQQSNHGLRLAGRHLWSPHFSTSIHGSYSDYGYRYREFPQSFDESIIDKDHGNDVALGSYSISNKLSYESFSATLGYEYNTWDAQVVFADRANDEEDLYGNQSREQVIYFALHPNLSPNLSLDLGARWSAYNKSDKGRKLLEPRLHMRYKLNSYLSIHGHYGKYHQYLSRRNFFTPLQADNGFWYLSDESATDFLDYINIIESSQYGGGIDYSKGIVALSLDAYGKEIQNVWSSSYDLSVDENPYRVNDLSAFGFETMMAIKTNSHQFRTTYEYTNEDIAFDNIEGTSFNPFSQPHRLGITYGYQWKFLEGTIQYNFASGRPFTRATGLRTTTDPNGSVNGTFLDFEDILTGRVSNYQRIDVSVRTVPLGKRTKHSFGLQINNLSNQENIIKNQFFIDYKTTPAQVGLLQKAGVPRSLNVFWEMTIG